jgi:hypothetical protein
VRQALLDQFVAEMRARVRSVGATDVSDSLLQSYRRLSPPLPGCPGRAAVPGSDSGWHQAAHVCECAASLFFALGARLMAALGGAWQGYRLIVIRQE